MTPTKEAHFIALWQRGLSHEAMAQRLDCPVGTEMERSSAETLMLKLTNPRNGKIDMLAEKRRQPLACHRSMKGDR